MSSSKESSGNSPKSESEANYQEDQMHGTEDKQNDSTNKQEDQLYGTKGKQDDSTNKQEDQLDGTEDEENDSASDQEDQLDDSEYDEKDSTSNLTNASVAPKKTKKSVSFFDLKPKKGSADQKSSSEDEGSEADTPASVDAIRTESRMTDRLPSIDSSVDVIQLTRRVKPLPRCDCCALGDTLSTIAVPKLFGMLRVEKTIGQFAEFWIVAIPCQGGDSSDSLEALDERTEGLSKNFKFHLPGLKTGTLNELLKFMEDLRPLDNFVLGVTQQLVAYLREHLAESGQDPAEVIRVRNVAPAEYLVRFLWNAAKYPPWFDTQKLAALVRDEVTNVSTAFGRRIIRREVLERDLRPFERRSTVSLELRYLGDIVKEEHFVLNSEFLTTILVVVPNFKIDEWLRSYHTFSDLVAPNSSQKIFQDNTHSLFTVTLARKDVETFRENSRQQNFSVRDFTYSKEKLESERRLFENKQFARAKHKYNTYHWAKVQFEECFEAWVHVKAMQAFAETRTRFGPKDKSEAMLIVPLRSRTKLRRVLDGLYEEVDNSLARGTVSEVPGSLLDYGVTEYYPYVYLNIDLAFVQIK